MTCTDYTERLSALLDGELPPAELAATTRHVATCPDCSQQLAELAELRAALRAQLPEEELPPEYLARMNALLDQAPAEAPSEAPSNIVPFKKRLPRERLGWIGVVTATAAMLLLTAMPHPDKTRDFAAVRDASMRLAMTQEIAPATAPAAPGFQPVAARMDEVAGHQAQVFTYAGAGQKITLCVWAANAEAAHGVEYKTYQGTAIAYWSDGKTEYWAATDGDPATLNRFVGAVKT